MISIQDKHAIYDILLQHGSFHNKHIREYIDKYTPTEFEEIGIKVTSAECHILVRIDGLYEYGIELERMGDFYGAGIVYNCCHKVDKHDPKVNFKLFLYHISIGNSLRGVNHLREFQTNADESYKKLGNLLMLLETYIMSIPYRDEVKDFTLQDILIDEGSQDKEVEKKNNMRRKIYVQDITGALEDFSKTEYDPSPFSLTTAIHSLLVTAKAHKTKVTKTLSKLIKEGAIFKAFQLLKDERERHNLIPIQQLEYTVLESIVSMEKSGMFLLQKEPQNFTIEELIATNNLLDAYDMVIDEECDNYQNLILLLKKAIKIDKENKEKSGISPKLEDIYLLLQDGQYEKSTFAIEDYLCQRDLEEYYYIFSLFLRASKNKIKDVADDLIAILQKVSPGYVIDSGPIFELYHDSLHRGDEQRALAYANILKKAVRRGHTHLEEKEVLNMLSDHDAATPKSLTNTPVEQTD